VRRRGAERSRSGDGGQSRLSRTRARPAGSIPDLRKAVHFSAERAGAGLGSSRSHLAAAAATISGAAEKIEMSRFLSDVYVRCPGMRAGTATSRFVSGKSIRY